MSNTSNNMHLQFTIGGTHLQLVNNIVLSSKYDSYFDTASLYVRVQRLHV